MVLLYTIVGCIKLHICLYKLLIFYILYFSVSAQDLEIAEAVFNTDLEVVTHTYYCQRVAADNLRTGRGDEAMSNDDDP